MYQGRFESKSVAARAAGKKEAEQKLPEELNIDAVLADIPAEEPEETEFLPMTPVAESAEQPAAEPEEEPAEKPVKKAKRGPRTHTIVFYVFYLLFIAAFCFGVHYLLGELDGFLVKYEASQPDVKSAEVFNQHFADPNWGSIYDMTAATSTTFDGKASFETYMISKVGNEELTFVETSMGLSQDKKFLLRLGEENIGYFTLTNTAGAVAIPQWELAEVSIYTSSDRDVTIHSYPGYTVKINGVALGDEHIIRRTSTRVEEYLPDGLIGPRTVSYYVDGLLVAPAVTVEDAEGSELLLTYDAENNAYSHETVSTTITDVQTKTLEEATRTYGAFMIDDAGKNDLKKYFVDKSYDSITQAELMFVQDHKGHDFTPLKITEFYAYSDTFCSARVSRTLEVERKNGTIKEFDINFTVFMEERDGKWKIVDMTYADVQAGKTEIRLRYFADGVLLGSEIVDSKTQMLEPPTVEVPEGKKLVWCIQTVDENGKKTFKPMYEVNEFDEILPPAGVELNSMDLHAVVIEEE